MSLSADHRDALKELVNIGVGRAAAELNEMLASPIELSVPSVDVLTPDTFSRSFDESGGETVSLVQLPFEGAFTGRALLAFPSESATKLVCLLMGEDADTVTLDNVRAGTLTEVGNILLNSVMGSITNVLAAEVHYRVPSFYEDHKNRILSLERDPTNTTVMAARTTFCVRDLAIEGHIHLVFAVEAFDALLLAIDRASAAA